MFDDCNAAFLLLVMCCACQAKQKCYHQRDVEPKLSVIVHRRRQLRCGHRGPIASLRHHDHNERRASVPLLGMMSGDIVMLVKPFVSPTSGQMFSEPVEVTITGIY